MAKLTENSYGKSSVQLTKVVRTGAQHELLEMSVDIRLFGDFAESYTTGDNSKIVATDSMKNTVYVLAKENTFTSIEEFAVLLARHFVRTYPQVESATVAINQTQWQRVAESGRPHTHAFIDGGTEKRTCRAEADGEKLTLHGGLSDLRFLKTTGSEFQGFVTDRFRTLPDASDRVFATSVTADWQYEPAQADSTSRVNTDYNATFAATRSAIISTLADHQSRAVQHTLLAIGRAILEKCPTIRSVRLSLPNLHRVPVNLKPFGLENSNEILTPMDEPFGVIEGTVERD